MATITQITSSTVTATVTGNTAYTLYTATSSVAAFTSTGISFTTPQGATTYSFTYTPTSGTYLALPLTSSGTPTAGTGTLYTDQAHGVAVASRLETITNVASGATFNLPCSTTTAFYNLTSTSLTGFVMVGPDPTQTGVYFVLRNNTTSTYLSLTPSSAAAPLTATITGITSPLVIPPGTSANLVWNGSGYTMF
jgi:hypothetical protein